MKNILKDLAHTIDRDKMLMSKVRYKRLGPISVLNRSFDGIGKHGSIKCSATGTFFFFNTVLRYFNFRLWNINDLALFDATAVDVTKTGAALMTELRRMCKDNVGIFNLREASSCMSWLGSRFFAGFAALTFGLLSQSIAGPCSPFRSLS